MKRLLALLSISFIFIGLYQLATHFLRKTHSLPAKPVEITQEATASSIEMIAGEESAMVSRVIDGDTIVLATGEKVRYIGMDTPELVHPKKPVECFAKEAKEANQKLVEGRAVRLEKDVSERDKYGRLLRYVFVGDIMVNDYLVRQGFAHVSTYPPDVRYQEQFRQAEREARENNRGLWAGCQIDRRK